MCASLCRNDLDCIQCTHMSNKYSVLTTNDDVNVATDTCVSGATCSDLNAPLFLSQYKVLAVPGDGYCFLHAISMSMKSQLNISHDVSSLLNLLHSEVMSNYDQYLSFLENPCPDTFSNDTLNHIGSGTYNTPFGDQVPLIMSNAMESKLKSYLLKMVGLHQILCNLVMIVQYVTKSSRLLRTGTIMMH